MPSGIYIRTREHKQKLQGKHPSEKTNQKKREFMNSHPNSGQFQKGHVTWNRGLPFPEKTKEKMSIADQSKPEDVWEKIDKKEEDGCWEWMGYKDKDGYGKLTYKSKYYRAHRLIYELEYGFIPERLYVLHKCDNPKCCNPNHLFLGTQQDNMEDMINKGRK